MSLTDVHDVFAAIHEDGLNDLLRRFFTTRPKYLNYGSPGFVAATTVNSTQMPAIQFPGIPGGIDWSVRIDLPRVDAHPQSTGLPPELDPLAAQRLSVHTKVEICVDCSDHGRPGREERPPETGHHHPDERQPDGREPGKHEHPDKPPRGDLKPTCFAVEVFAVTHAERTSSVDGDAVRLIVDDLELVDIEPNRLESVIECLLLKILRAVLASVRLPLTALRAGAFQLVPTAGPGVEDHSVEMFGAV
jgi:hypothetical protein